MGFFSAFKKFFSSKDEAKPEETKAPEEKLEQPASPAGIESAKIQQSDEGEETAQSGRQEDSAKARVSHFRPEELETEREIVAEPEIAAEPDLESGSKDGVMMAGGLLQKEAPVTATPEASEPEQPAARAAARDEALLLALRSAEPRLSAWLEIILQDQQEVNAEFWQRLRFLLEALEAPDSEIDAFIADFETWLKRMDYNYVDEFRSELQYRLALALELEDEEDERNRLLVKLSQGLAATREHFGRRLDSLFARHGELNAAFWEEMEELFIMADMGYEASIEIVERLKKRASASHASEAAQARKLLQDELEEIFKIQPKIRAVNKPEVILMMGVNGAGKTTTIAKLAHRAKMGGKKVLVAAADTFRAAAIEQLQVWAERAGGDFYARPAGSDPAAVAWEAMDYALANDIDVVFIDTAGRLQTRVNLMEELGKIRQVLGKKHPGAPHRSMLVLDATTGQNALSQARLFREAAGADEIVLTKLDGTAKGGVAIAVAMREKLPITFIGLGEKMEDLRPFDGRDFARALLEDSQADSLDEHLNK